MKKLILLEPNKKFLRENNTNQYWVSFTEESIKELFDKYEGDKTNMFIDENGAWVMMVPETDENVSIEFDISLLQNHSVCKELTCSANMWHRSDMKLGVPASYDSNANPLYKKENK